MRIQAVLACISLVPTLALAQDDAPAKRSEGRYFVELSEIMLSAHDFDLAIANIDPEGPRTGAAAYQDIAELSGRSAEAPRVTIGLNRPSGKTQFSLQIFDFDLADKQIPAGFEVRDQVVTTPLLPPGIVFQRQAPLPGTGINSNAVSDNIPNWGNDYGFIRRADFKTLGLFAQHNLHEGKSMRWRWIGGARFAQLEQRVAFRMAYFPEAVSQFGNDVQDFFNFESSVSTHGIGPTLGLNGRMLLGKKKKWSFEGQFDVAFLPESSSVKYGLGLVEQSAEFYVITYEDPPGTIRRIIRSNSEAPVIPGVGNPPGTPGEPFTAQVNQTDFTEMTTLITAQGGVRWQVTPSFGVGLDLWQMRWRNLLSQIGVLDTVNREATYQVIRGNTNHPDPQVRDTESVIHVPRFSQRDEFVFDGISLNLKFDF